MCKACDAGLECENGPGSSCNVSHVQPNPMIALIRGASRPMVTPVGRMAAGCAVNPAGWTAPSPYAPRTVDLNSLRSQDMSAPSSPSLLQRRLPSVPDWKPSGYSSDYRRHRPAGFNFWATPPVASFTDSNGRPAIGAKKFTDSNGFSAAPKFDLARYTKVAGAPQINANPSLVYEQASQSSTAPLPQLPETPPSRIPIVPIALAAAAAIVLLRVVK